MLRKINLSVICIFYFGAGCNHFVHPANYLSLIPPYFAHKEAINYISGSLEVIAAQLLLFNSTRKYGMYLTLLLLIVFIPAHIYMIQLLGCVTKTLCVPEWVAWLRLFPLQFVLMWWVYKTWKVNSVGPALKSFKE